MIQDKNVVGSVRRLQPSLPHRRQRPPPLPLLPIFHPDEVLHVERAHTGGFVRDVPEDNDGPPVADIFRPDAVRDLIRREAAHTETAAAPHRHQGAGGTHSDRLEGELQVRKRC